MKLINVSVKEFSISRFTVDKIDLNIYYEDPDQKILKRSLIIEDPKQHAVNLIKEIRTIEQNNNFEFDGEKPMDSYVHVIIENEEGTIKALSNFLKSVHSKVIEIKNKKNADNYLQLINELLTMKKRL